ncbi:MAG: hypothetical protein E7429_02170 [Ruminococcaceae bacterium]|nr:hypothetical protein [Oscillospiraceae bacterium]
MKLKIGFSCDTVDKQQAETAAPVKSETVVPRKSVVQVQFPNRGSALAYYNDRFDLRVGDFVFVDGKLEGQRGRVTAVNYNFKIKLSDYQRVIALADTAVTGQFHFAGSHVVTFDRCALPAEKVVTWFNPPAKEEDEFVSGSDDSAFRLDDLAGMKISPEIAQRGRDYYVNNNVLYLCLDGSRGYAIVQGNEAYEVELAYHDGEISRLTCSCFCSYNCKHEFAAMLQLRDTLDYIEKHYADAYERTGYFAAVAKSTLFFFAMDGSDAGSFTLN